MPRAPKAIRRKRRAARNRAAVKAKRVAELEIELQEIKSLIPPRGKVVHLKGPDSQSLKTVSGGLPTLGRQHR